MGYYAPLADGECPFVVEDRGTHRCRILELVTGKHLIEARKILGLGKGCRFYIPDPPAALAAKL